MHTAGSIRVRYQAARLGRVAHERLITLADGLGGQSRVAVRGSPRAPATASRARMSPPVASLCCRPCTENAPGRGQGEIHPGASRHAVLCWDQRSRHGTSRGGVCLYQTMSSFGGSGPVGSVSRSGANVTCSFRALIRSGTNATPVICGTRSNTSRLSWAYSRAFGSLPGCGTDISPSPSGRQSSARGTPTPGGRSRRSESAVGRAPTRGRFQRAAVRPRDRGRQRSSPGAGSASRH